MASRVAPTPYWTFGNTAPAYPDLTHDLRVDVVVIGAGMTGVTAAYLLKKAGLTVALLERGRVAQGETSHTTAHLTSVTDRPLSELARQHGIERAKAVWDAGVAAVAEIDRIVRLEHIDCDFESCPAYLVGSFETNEDERTRLENEATFTLACGFDATFVESVPGVLRPGVQFRHQSKFHPLKYVYGVLATIPGQGCYVFERSAVTGVLDDPLGIRACGHTIHTGYVVMATHAPIMGAWVTRLRTDLARCSTYAVRARIRRNRVPAEVVWDLGDPYYYLRVDSERIHDFVIIGGADHETGEADDPRVHYDRVERTLAALFPRAEITHRWCGQVIETRDGLPYLGETTARQFSATGFAGNGMTFGALGAMMARDAATGVHNRWRDVFDVNRTPMGPVMPRPADTPRTAQQE